MKIGIVSPYLDSLGGGERYTLTLASHWAKKHAVTLFWDDIGIIEEAKKRLNIDLSRVKIVQNIFRGTNFLKRLFLSRQYNLLFFLSDGSIPTTLAQANILHFQCPFPQVHGRSFGTQLKLKNYQTVVCNSRFTKRWIDQEFDVDSIVIYPPVPVTSFKPADKEKIVLSVGRFSKYFINKKQVEMVRFFRELHSRHPGWRLVLAGGLLDQDRPYFELVKLESVELPVELLPNISFRELKALYQKAAVYWHAAGFEEDEKKNPGAMEHFGISIIEAMASGCLPIVYHGGGLPEIVTDGTDGFLWHTKQDLIEKTERVILQPDLHKNMQEAIRQRAQDFCEERFCQAFDNLLSKIKNR